MDIWLAVLLIIIVTVVLVGAIYWREHIRLKRAGVEESHEEGVGKQRVK